MGDAVPMPVAIRPSPRLVMAFLLAHGSAAAAVASLPLDPSASFSLIFVFLANGIYLVMRHGRLSLPGSVVGLEMNQDGTWFLHERGGRKRMAVLLDECHASPHLAVIRFRPAGRRLARSIVILPDAVDPEAFRRLRIWLRWGRAAGPRPRVSDPA
ncbi:MAG: hypothetical protein HYU77_02655 [Betaproteobacteria bacterium]|nr:hypothetical protein [Betaproteobacteria bacterium]